MSTSSSVHVFQHEIKCMMYSFGDVRHPNTECATIVEDIVYKQMTETISQVSSVTNMRGARAMSVDDVLFLLRKDKDKLKRLTKHLQMKEVAKKASTHSTSEEDQSAGSTSTGNKRRKMSLDFLGPADQPDDGVDEVQLERLQRQDTITMNMDRAEYLEYTECRSTHFNKNTTKFKEWLGISSMDPKPSQEVVEVLGYLSYESVREIVELALLVKEDMESVTFDPQPGHTLQSSTQSQFGTTPTFFTVPVNDSKSPPTSPPTSSSPSTSTPTTQPTTTRGRKRKQKSGSGSSEPAATTPNIATPPHNALQPVHIREALRRYTSAPRPLNPFATHVSKPSFITRTLCV